MGSTAGNLCYGAHVHNNEQETWRVREECLREVARDQPGCTSYVNDRPIRVRKKHDRWSLIEILNAVHPHICDGQWRERVAAGLIRVDGKLRTPGYRLRMGATIMHRMPEFVEPKVNSEIQWVYEDQDLLVVNKPAPLPVHPCGRFNKNTLLSFLHACFDERFRPAHRLDANTTGLQVFTKSAAAARAVQGEFEARRVEKLYWVLVNVEDSILDVFSGGNAIGRSWVVDRPIERAPARAGTRRLVSSDVMGTEAAGDAQQSPKIAEWPARTEFRVLNVRGQRALLEAKPITGRTNQIRLHLSACGCPVVSDLAYGAQPELSGGLSGEIPIALHAKELSFRHPSNDHVLSIVAQHPVWVQNFIDH